MLTDQHVNTQQLLFGHLPVVEAGEFVLPEMYYERGYIVLDHVSDYQQAEQMIRQGVAGLDVEKLPLLKSLKNRIELAKVDAIPDCGDSIDTKCQALHFDMGQPFVYRPGEMMVTNIGLYLLPDQPTMNAQTRILPLEKLRAAVKGITSKELEQRFLDYIEVAGDGWDEPTPVNTKRLTCFGRVLDAVYKKDELHCMRNQTMAQWFDDLTGELATEEEFYASCGIDLTEIEERVTLEPGQLLIIDNLRCAHGRVGNRYMNELYQFMYGVKEVEEQEVNSFRNWVLDRFIA